MHIYTNAIYIYIYIYIYTHTHTHTHTYRHTSITTHIFVYIHFEVRPIDSVSSKIIEYIFQMETKVGLLRINDGSKFLSMYKEVCPVALTLEEIKETMQILFYILYTYCFYGRGNLNKSHSKTCEHKKQIYKKDLNENKVLISFYQLGVSF